MTVQRILAASRAYQDGLGSIEESVVPIKTTSTAANLREIVSKDLGKMSSIGNSDIIRGGSTKNVFDLRRGESPKAKGKQSCKPCNSP